MASTAPPNGSPRCSHQRGRACGPRHTIGNPEQRLIHAASVLEHQPGLRLAMTMTDALAADAVLAALDPEPLDGPLL